MTDQFLEVEDEVSAPASPLEMVPHNPEAEQSVIGSVLINPECFHACRLQMPDGLVEFYIERNQWLWEAFEALTAAKRPIDLITVDEELFRKGRLDEIGGPAYVTSLINVVPSSLNAEAYAAIVHEKYVRRKMIAALNKSAAFAFDQNKDIEEVGSQTAAEINQVIRISSKSKMVTIADAVRRMDEIIEANSQLDRLPGIQTPLVDLNKMMGGGAQKTDLNLIIGRPGQGKSTLLMQIALHAARYKVGETVVDQGTGYGIREDVFEENTVVFFTCEMPPEQLVMRLACQISDIDFQRLRSGKLKDDEWSRYYKAVEELSTLSIFLEYTPGLKPSHVRARLEVLSAQMKIDLVCVDSLNLMKSDIDFGRRTDQAMDSCAQELKNIAGEFNVAMWAAHQMNRGIEQRGDNSRPKLSDMREGGEQPADGCWFIWHELSDPDDQIKAETRIAKSEIICEKQRNGPTGSVPVYFKQDRFKFESITKIKLS